MGPGEGSKYLGRALSYLCTENQGTNTAPVRFPHKHHHLGQLPLQLGPPGWEAADLRVLFHFLASFPQLYPNWSR